ncbi:MAG TPA: NAD(P)H-dependent oxidoreductase subunit E [Candidatus Cybelea sp.]|jgi:NADH-quinone oxidoreductase subunit F|nr:NAD(P)H-dependent oxidoreductase subunit E [Candidatus Cybelea sp.]
MDLHFTSDAPTDAERGAVDDALGRDGDAAAGTAARSRRHLLLPVLHALQDRIGWISPGALNYAGRRLDVAPADAYGVATFYALFSTTPRAPRVVHVCDDIACIFAGAESLCVTLESTFGPPGTHGEGGETTWLRSPCLGLCDRAPAALVTVAGDVPSARQIAPVHAHGLTALMATGARGGEPAAPHVGGSELRLLRRVGKTDPESLDDYRAHGGYRALREAFELGPQGVIAEVQASNLLGRGGAAFPTGRKMEAVASAPERPHYLVCNADESEPGTFKDRILIEYDPYAIVEAMTIAAYAIGCERGFVYIRGEYPRATQRLSNAITQARRHGLLGDDVMSRGMRFDIEIRRGAGAYICGEETALFNSIEGKRGEPRSKPPFPVQAGLFGKPTQINNVETLANLPLILLEGGAAYARAGTPGSTGTRLFCLSGAIERPGLYEVPHGTTLGALVELAGGVAQEARLQAILLGGAAGVMVSPDALSMPLTFEDARAANATLGSGVVMLFDESVDLVGILRRIARFFRDESCGQCVPCRVGTVRQEEALERRDVVLLDEIGRAMRDASICGLGQTAASVIASAQTNLKILAARAAQ